VKKKLSLQLAIEQSKKSSHSAIQPVIISGNNINFNDKIIDDQTHYV